MGNGILAQAQVSYIYNSDGFLDLVNNCGFFTHNTCFKDIKEETGNPRPYLVVFNKALNTNLLFYSTTSYDETDEHYKYRENIDEQPEELKKVIKSSDRRAMRVYTDHNLFLPISNDLLTNNDTKQINRFTKCKPAETYIRNIHDSKEYYKKIITPRPAIFLVTSNNQKRFYFPSLLYILQYLNYSTSAKPYELMLARVKNNEGVQPKEMFAHETDFISKQSELAPRATKVLFDFLTHNTYINSQCKVFTKEDPTPEEKLLKDKIFLFLRMREHTRDKKLQYSSAKEVVDYITKNHLEIIDPTQNKTAESRAAELSWFKKRSAEILPFVSETLIKEQELLNESAEVAKEITLIMEDSNMYPLSNVSFDTGKFGAYLNLLAEAPSIKEQLVQDFINDEITNTLSVASALIETRRTNEENNIKKRFLSIHTDKSKAIDTFLKEIYEIAKKAKLKRELKEIKDSEMLEQYARNIRHKNQTIENTRVVASFIKHTPQQGGLSFFAEEYDMVARELKNFKYLPACNPSDLEEFTQIAEELSGLDQNKTVKQLIGLFKNNEDSFNSILENCFSSFENLDFDNPQSPESRYFELIKGYNHFVLNLQTNAECINGHNAVLKKIEEFENAIIRENELNTEMVLYLSDLEDFTLKRGEVVLDNYINAFKDKVVETQNDRTATIREIDTLLNSLNKREERELYLQIQETRETLSKKQESCEVFLSEALNKEPYSNTEADNLEEYVIKKFTLVYKQLTESLTEKYNHETDEYNLTQCAGIGMKQYLSNLRSHLKALGSCSEEFTRDLKSIKSASEKLIETANGLYDYILNNIRTESKDWISKYPVFNKGFNKLSTEEQGKIIEECMNVVQKDIKRDSIFKTMNRILKEKNDSILESFEYEEAFKDRKEIVITRYNSLEQNINESKKKLLEYIYKGIKENFICHFGMLLAERYTDKTYDELDQMILKNAEMSSNILLNKEKMFQDIHDEMLYEEDENEGENGKHG